MLNCGKAETLSLSSDLLKPTSVSAVSKLPEGSPVPHLEMGLQAGWVVGRDRLMPCGGTTVLRPLVPQAGGRLKLLNPRSVDDHPAGACGTGPALTLHEALPEATAFPVTVGTKLCSSSRTALWLAFSV